MSQQQNNPNMLYNMFSKPNGGISCGPRAFHPTASAVAVHQIQRCSGVATLRRDSNVDPQLGAFDAKAALRERRRWRRQNGWRWWAMKQKTGCLKGRFYWD